MAAEERASAPVRGTLFCGHHRYGRRAGAVGGVHRGLSHRQHGQRLGQTGQPPGRPPPSPVLVLDARAAVLVYSALLHRARVARGQTYDRVQTDAGRSHIRR